MADYGSAEPHPDHGVAASPASVQPDQPQLSRFSDLRIAGKAALAGMAFFGFTSVMLKNAGLRGADVALAPSSSGVDTGSLKLSEFPKAGSKHPESSQPKASMTTTSTKPHILFFLLDDAGWNDFGYNSVDLSGASPNMDMLASAGIKLPNYYTQPSCTPSRASLLTGQYPISIGFQHECIQSGSGWGLPLSITILPQYLKEGGYHTAMIGKWDMGHFSQQLWPTNRGFDSWVGITNRGISNYETYDNGGYTDIHRGTENFYTANGTYSTLLFKDEALFVLGNHSAYHAMEPLFLYLAFNAIHDTLSVPGSFEEETIYSSLTENITYDMRKRAAGAMYIADMSIGEIVSELADLNMYDNSIIVCASDNGGSPVDGSNNWPLRGGKKDYYQGGVRVPAFIHSVLLEGTKHQGGYYKGLFHVSDWLPTLVHGAAGLTKPDGLTFDGHSQWDAINTGVSTYKESPRTEILHNIDYIDSESEEVFVNATNSNAALTADVDGTVYKLILNYRGNSNGMWYLPYTNTGSFYEASITGELNTTNMNYGNETCFLFDLQSDPFERVNLWDRAPFQKVRRTLTSKICDYWENRMVSSLYQSDVSGPTKAVMVDAYKNNDNYITWWDDEWANISSHYPLSELGMSKCPFKGLVGDRVSDLPPMDIVGGAADQPAIPGTPYSA